MADLLNINEHRIPTGGNLPSTQGTFSGADLLTLISQMVGGQLTSSQIAGLLDILRGWAPGLAEKVGFSKQFSLGYGSTPEAQGLFSILQGHLDTSKKQMGNLLAYKFGLSQRFSSEIGHTASGLATMLGLQSELAMLMPNELIDSSTAIQTFVNKGGSLTDVKGFQKFVNSDIFSSLAGRTSVPRQLVIDAYAYATKRYGKEVTFGNALQLSNIADYGVSGLGLGKFSQMSDIAGSYGREAVFTNSTNLLFDLDAMKVLLNRTGGDINQVQALAQIIQKQFGGAAHYSMTSGLLGMAAGQNAGDASTGLKRAATEAYSSTLASDNMKILAALYERSGHSVKTQIRRSLDKGDSKAISQFVDIAKKSPTLRNSRNDADVAQFSQLIGVKGQQAFMKSEIHDFVAHVKGKASRELIRLLGGDKVGGMTLEARIQSNNWSGISNQARSMLSAAGPTHGRLLAAWRSLTQSQIADKDLQAVRNQANQRGKVDNLLDLGVNAIQQIIDTGKSALTSVKDWFSGSPSNSPKLDSMLATPPMAIPSGADPAIMNTPSDYAPTGR